MLILVSVSQDFKHPSVLEEQFTLDIDANQNIENLKILITLKFVDLGPNDFYLICVPTKYRLEDHQFVHSITKDDVDKIHVEMRRSYGTCTLI